MTINKLLIANRGEIAVRIIRTCRKLGIRSVAVYSDVDRDARHVQQADEAIRLGPAPASESYLNIPAIIAAARQSGADAIHPGYGFLSEREAFASAVIEAGLIWVGPKPAAIRALGDKITAKRLMDAAGVPTVPGYYDPERQGQDSVLLHGEAERIGFPLLIKASAGGGGKGMRLVERIGDFGAALEGAQREAQAAFGDGAVFLERYIRNPRHIEFQIIGDDQGNVVHLGERECSIQRRHQKVLEESPSPAPQMTPELRERMGAAAVAAGKAANYSNAGTVEFILDAAGNYYFLEMNTRLQVEHPVTEETTNVPLERGGANQPLDLVELQIRIAQGEELPFTQADVLREGHAIEVRIYAEDPTKGFLPASGTLTRFNPPEAYGIRNETGVEAGDEVSIYYDPMLAKLITFGPDRETARARMVRALSEYDIAGVANNVGFLFWLAQNPEFAAGNTDTGFLERYYQPGAEGAEQPPAVAAIAAAAYEMFGGLLKRHPYNPWHDAKLALNGSGPTLSYNYQSPGSPDNTAPQGTIQVRFSRTAGGWRGESGGESALVREDQNFWEGVRLQTGEREVRFTVDSPIDGYDLFVVRDEHRAHTFRRPPPLSTDTLSTDAHLATGDRLEAPMPGKIVGVLVQEGQQVSEGDRLVVMEAMKMEFTVRAPHNGHVRALPVTAGQQVKAGTVLVELEA